MAVSTHRLFGGYTVGMAICGESGEAEVRFASMKFMSDRVRAGYVPAKK